MSGRVKCCLVDWIVCVSVYTRVHLCPCIYMHIIHTWMHMHTCMCTYTHTYIHVRKAQFILLPCDYFERLARYSEWLPYAGKSLSNTQYSLLS